MNSYNVFFYSVVLMFGATICADSAVSALQKEYQVALAQQLPKARYQALGVVLTKASGVESGRSSPELIAFMAQCRAAQKATGYKPWRKWLIGGGFGATAAILAFIAWRLQLNSDLGNTSRENPPQNKGADGIKPNSSSERILAQQEARVKRQEAVRQAIKFFDVPDAGQSTLLRDLNKPPLTRVGLDPFLTSPKVADAYTKIWRRFNRSTDWLRYQQAVADFSGASFIEKLVAVITAYTPHEERMSDHGDMLAGWLLLLEKMQPLVAQRVEYALCLSDKYLFASENLKKLSDLIHLFVKAPFYQSLLEEMDALITKINHLGFCSSDDIDLLRVQISTSAQTVSQETILPLFTAYDKQQVLLSNNAANNYSQFDCLGVTS